MKKKKLRKRLKGIWSTTHVIQNSLRRAETGMFTSDKSVLAVGDYPKKPSEIIEEMRGSIESLERNALRVEKAMQALRIENSKLRTEIKELKDISSVGTEEKETKGNGKRGRKKADVKEEEKEES